MSQNFLKRHPGKSASSLVGFVPIFLVAVVCFIAVIVTVKAENDPNSPELLLYSRLKANLAADKLEERENCIFAIRAIFAVGSDDHMVTVFGYQKNGKPGDIYYALETVVRPITENNNERVIKNSRDLKIEEVKELLDLLDSREMFDLPTMRKQKDEKRAIFAFAERWDFAKKSSKIIARDLHESRVMDEFIRILYLLAGTVSH